MIIRKNPKSIRRIKEPRLKEPKHGEHQRTCRIFQSRGSTSLFREAQNEIGNSVRLSSGRTRDEVVCDWKQGSEIRREQKIEKSELGTLRHFQNSQLSQSPSACDVIENCVRRHRKRKVAMEMDRTPDSYQSKISRQSRRNRSPRVPVVQESTQTRQQLASSSTMYGLNRNIQRHNVITTHGQATIAPYPFFYGGPGGSYMHDWYMHLWIHRS